MNAEFKSIIQGIKQARKDGAMLSVVQTNFLDRVQTANRHFRNTIHRMTGITQVTNLRPDQVSRLEGMRDRMYAQRADAADAYSRQRAVILGKSQNEAVKRNQQTRKALAQLANLHTEQEQYDPEHVYFFKRFGLIPLNYPEVRRRMVVQKQKPFRVGAVPVV